MKKSMGTLKAIVLALALSALGFAAFAADQASDDAKAYHAELETMKGQPPASVIAKLEGWQFVVAGAWKAESPTAKDISKHAQGKVKFSKQEIKEVFGEPGQYKIAIYSKVVGTSSATMGAIDEMGRSIHKDAAIENKIYTVVRLVFKEDKLVNVRTWPKIDSSSMSGGNAWRVW